MYDLRWIIMGIGTVIKTQVVTNVLKILCSDFIEAIGGKSYNFGEKSLENIQKDKRIAELAEFLTRFDEDTTTPFLSDLQAAFSKENIRSILREVRQDGRFDLESVLQDKLIKLCSDYGISDEGDYIIQNLVEMYFELAADCDSSLANKLFYHRLYKQGSEMMGMLVNITAQQQQLLSNQSSYEMQNPIDDSGIAYQDGGIVGSDEDLFEWKLELYQSLGSFGSQQNRKKEVLGLIDHWRKERLRYPGWYIAPVGKREILFTYTRDEDLLWCTDSLSLQEKLDFSYELIWRHETAMGIFGQTLQKNIYTVWRTYLDKNVFGNAANNEKWFYIGQSLLRDYREDMNWEKWNELYYSLYGKRDFLINGEEELNLEFVKQLFSKMLITDVRDKVQQFTCSKQLYAIRLQKYGLMAECGLLQEAYIETKELIADLKEVLSSLEQEKTKERVYCGSLLACTQYLLSLIVQGLYPFKHPDELVELWKDQKDYEKFYNFEQEKYQWNNNLYNYYCKHAEIPFELDRTTRTKHFGSDGSEKVYSFYRVLDRMGIPLSVGMVRLLPHQEIEFIGVILKIAPYLGSYLLLRTGNEKTVNAIITRRFCIEMGFEKCRRIFDYVYSSLEQNLESIRVNPKKGNAYAHLLKNALEILRRLVSTTSIIQQKKIMTLMCKLIDTDVMQEVGVMDKWISQVLKVVDEKIKAQFLNEFLMLSTKNRSHTHNEKSLDPFDVISSNISAKKYYEQAKIESSIIEKLISRANDSDEDRVIVISRLEKLYQWKQLSQEQIEKLCMLMWNNTNEKTGLPNLNQYYGAAFLQWPTPEGKDVKALVRQYIMSPEWYDNLRNRKLSSVTMGSTRLFDELVCLNSLFPKLLTQKDKEKILEYFIEYWNLGRKEFESNKNKEFYREEFIDRYQSLEKVISSFSIEELSKELKQHLKNMFQEMKFYGINVLSARAVICNNPCEGDLLIKETIDAFYSDNRKTILDATKASEIIIDKGPDSKEAKQLLSEQIRLIRYGRQPGLMYFLISIYNLAYLEKLNLSKEAMSMLNKALLECSIYTSYSKISDKSESAIKDLIRLRRSCAGTASMLSKLIAIETDEMSRIGIEKWKEICNIDEPPYEFMEVKRAWL